MFALRPYQVELKRALYRHIREGKRRVLACSATGTGKTEFAGAVTADLLSKGGRSLFVVDRKELCDQTAKRFLKRYNFPSAVCQGDHPLSDPTAPIQVGTWQTLTRRREWLMQWLDAAPGTVLVFWDEAHETMWTNFADWLLQQTATRPNVIHVGLTATPDRLKRSEGMADVCDSLASGLLPGQAMEQNFLVWDRYVDVPLTGVDLTALKIKTGDYDEAQLADLMSQPATILTAVNAYQTHAADRTAIAYCVNVKHAQALDQAFRLAGVRSAVIHGESPDDERKEALEALDTGRLQVLCNCAIAIKALDVPRVKCILFSRPTKSRALWFQAVGRGLRPFEDATDCIILDQGNCCDTHGRARDYPAYKLKKGIPPGERDPDEETDGPILIGWKCRHCQYEPNPASQNACRKCGERRQIAKGRDFAVEYPEGAYIAPVGSILENIPCRIHWMSEAESPFFYAGFRHPADKAWRTVCGQLPKDRDPNIKPREWVRLTGMVREHVPPKGDKEGATRLVNIQVAPDTTFLLPSH